MRLCLFFAFACVIASSALSQESDNTAARQRVLAAVNRYTDASTLAVGYIDLDPSWVEGVQTELVKQLGDERGGDLASNHSFGLARTLLAGAKASGGREVIVIASVSDVNPNRGPLVIVTSQDEGDDKRIHALVGGMVEIIAHSMGLHHLNTTTLPASLDGHGNVLVGTPRTVERYLSLAPTDRPDLTGPLGRKLDEATARGDASAAVVVAPGSDARRVIRELWPTLPEPFAKATGPLIADELSEFTLTATRPPQWRVEVELAASSSTAADTFAQLIDSAYQRGREQVAAKHPELSETVQQASKLLAPERRENSLVVRLDHDNRQAEELFKQVLLPAVGKARAAAYRNQRMNNMKQIALAMLNYESANGNYPAAAAIVDNEGKPLLSWRVAILPYMEDSALYQQFHLDEPWDSPHNLKLAQTVPQAYINPTNSELAAEGKTVYQVPAHPSSVFGPPPESADPEKALRQGTVYYRATGMPIRQVKDGTSNTVLIVEVPPEDAVVWTKPADWEVDLAKAWQQLKGQGTTNDTVAAFCDGSAHAWDHGTAELEENLPKFITRDGGEIVEW